MTPDERKHYEQEAPTRGHKERLYSTLSEKNAAFLAAAREGDIPSMASALKQGADPKARRKEGYNAALQYAHACIAPSCVTGHAPSTHVGDPSLMREGCGEKGWAWLKAHGVSLHERLGKMTPWSILYRANHLTTLTSKEKRSLPFHGYYWPEKHLWSLWDTLSVTQRHAVLTWMDAEYVKTGPTMSGVQYTSSVPLKGSFSSALLKEAAFLEEEGRSLHKQVLSLRRIQERTLVLSSLLAARHHTALPSVMSYSFSQMLLGLWAFAPRALLHELREMPAYSEKVNTCLSPLADCLVRHRTQNTLGMDLCRMLALRLAHGVKTTLETGHVFPSDVLQSFMRLEEVRNVVEQHTLQDVLGVCPSSTLPLLGHALPGVSKTRTRL